MAIWNFSKMAATAILDFSKMAVAAILDLFELEIAPFDPPSPKTLP